MDVRLGDRPSNTVLSVVLDTMQTLLLCFLPMTHVGILAQVAYDTIQQRASYNVGRAKKWKYISSRQKELKAGSFTVPIGHPARTLQPHFMHFFASIELEGCRRVCFHEDRTRSVRDASVTLFGVPEFLAARRKAKNEITHARRNTHERTGTRTHDHNRTHLEIYEWDASLATMAWKQQGKFHPQRQCRGGHATPPRESTSNAILALLAPGETSHSRQPWERELVHSSLARFPQQSEEMVQGQSDAIQHASIEPRICAGRPRSTAFVVANVDLSPYLAHQAEGKRDGRKPACF